MSTIAAVWHGTDTEQAEWEKALAHNCSCEWEEASGYRSVICPAHQAAESDQRLLNGVLYVRHSAHLYLREEFDLGTR